MYRVQAAWSKMFGPGVDRLCTDAMCYRFINRTKRNVFVILGVCSVHSMQYVLRLFYFLSVSADREHTLVKRHKRACLLFFFL